MASQRGITHNTILIHYIAAALHLLGLPIFMYFSARDAGGHYFSPHLLALVHWCVLGWFLPITFGAVYQLLPSMAGTGVRFRSITLPVLSIYFAGVWLMVYSFWQFRTGTIMLIGAGLLLAAVTAFVMNMLLTAERGKRKSLQLQMMQVALLWLWLTVFFGFLMALNFTYPFLTADHLRVLKIHAHMGLLGWFLQLILGAGMEMLPNFLLSKRQESPYLKTGFYLFNIGLALLLPAFLISDIPGFRVLPGVMGLFGGLLIYMLHLRTTFLRRARKKLDPPLLLNMFCWPMLALAATAGLSSAFLAAPVAFTPAKLYVFLFLFGFVACTIIAHSFKMLPFEVWLYRFTGAKARQEARPADLYSRRIFRWTAMSYLGFVAAGIGGLSTGITFLMQLAAALLFLTALLYGTNMARVITRRPSQNE